MGSEINDILDTMNFPELRRVDHGWLRRNIGINNLDNPLLPRLMFLLKTSERNESETQP